MSKKAVIIVIDGLGAGPQGDTAKYGDLGADTLGHVYENARPNIKNLEDLGIKNLCGFNSLDDDEPLGSFGLMSEKSAGKDTTTGHWELAGLTLKAPFPTYKNGFPKEVMDLFTKETGMDYIGNCAASGTEIINRLGDEHVKTGKLIVYTSADSVFQIAAHEDIVPPEELWHICRIARNRVLTGKHAVGRIIARPFTGTSGNYTRTGNRRDFSLDPIGPTMLDLIKQSGKQVIGVGKIEDIFNHKGLTKSVHPDSNMGCLDKAVEFLKQDFSGLMFINLVETDSHFGHRRDLKGFSKCLEDIDSRLPELFKYLGDDGMLIITADHGCDPTFTKTTDHTREKVPLMVWGLSFKENNPLKERDTFSDVSATVLEWLGVNNTLDGTSFLSEIIL